MPAGLPKTLLLLEMGEGEFRRKGDSSADKKDAHVRIRNKNNCMMWVLVNDMFTYVSM